jgi:hypothetical protein
MVHFRWRYSAWQEVVEEQDGEIRHQYHSSCPYDYVHGMGAVEVLYVLVKLAVFLEVEEQLAPERCR